MHYSELIQSKVETIEPHPVLGPSTLRHHWLQEQTPMSVSPFMPSTQISTYKEQTLDPSKKRRRRRKEKLCLKMGTWTGAPELRASGPNRSQLTDTLSD